MKPLLVFAIAALLIAGCEKHDPPVYSPIPHPPPADPVTPTLLTIDNPIALKKFKIQLYWAIREGNEKKVIEFIAAKKDVNVVINRGRTPLHYAVDFGQDEIAQMLISAGADINARTLVGDTPLDYANYKQNELIAGILRRLEARACDR
jgi:ankyrin repeat protein